ncbi:MAG: hypothetical protein FWF92_06050 [Oscillospiraceae bacterium]|nr:hypothetical protein [Oscillospiraceae bacterium]
MKDIKKYFILTLLFLSVLSIIFTITSCKSDTSTIKDFTGENDIVNDSTEEWRNAYIWFLGEFYIDTHDDNIYSFSLRDFDNNAIPELIILKSDMMNDGVLEVHFYDESGIYKIGEYHDPKVAAGYRVSDNPLFPGLFTLWWGGGKEYYGYLTVVESELIYEDVWLMDRTKESPVQTEISNNEQLIAESVNAHPPYDYPDNLLEMHLVNADNILEIIMSYS